MPNRPYETKTVYGGGEWQEGAPVSSGTISIAALQQFLAGNSSQLNSELSNQPIKTVGDTTGRANQGAAYMPVQTVREDLTNQRARPSSRLSSASQLPPGMSSPEKLAEKGISPETQARSAANQPAEPMVQGRIPTAEERAPAGMPVATAPPVFEQNYKKPVPTIMDYDFRKSQPAAIAETPAALNVQPNVIASGGTPVPNFPWSGATAAPAAEETFVGEKNVTVREIDQEYIKKTPPVKAGVTKEQMLQPAMEGGPDSFAWQYYKFWWGDPYEAVGPRVPSSSSNKIDGSTPGNSTPVINENGITIDGKFLTWQQYINQYGEDSLGLWFNGQYYTWAEWVQHLGLGGSSSQGGASQGSTPSPVGEYKSNQNSIPGGTRAGGAQPLPWRNK